MPIPDYQTIMLPLLQVASDGRERQLQEVTESLAGHFSLTVDERNEMLPSGNQLVFANRVSWARTYLKQAGLLTNPRRGTFKITDSGQALVKESPARIDVKLLERYPSFLEFLNRRRGKEASNARPAIELDETPEDSLATAYRKLRGDLEAELLQ